jgi:hypothetical protein
MLSYYGAKLPPFFKFYNGIVYLSEMRFLRSIFFKFVKIQNPIF